MKNKSSVKNFLIRAGLASSELEAEKLVLARRVLLNGILVDFAGQEAKSSDQLSLVPNKKYFSRAGEKLDFALRAFNLNVENYVCADVGCSTGGFSGVLLDSGASKIYAIDVARGEIAWKLRTDPRIVLMEKTNARDLLTLPEPIDLVTIDVSFISTDLILPNVRSWIKPNANVVVLVKPQFEANRDCVPLGGVITNSEVHRMVLKQFAKNVRQIGFVFCAVQASPILGMQGNKEFLALLAMDGVDLSEKELDSMFE